MICTLVLIFVKQPYDVANCRNERCDCQLQSLKEGNRDAGQLKEKEVVATNSMTTG